MSAGHQDGRLAWLALMLDVRTLLVVLAATAILLSIMLWLAVGPRFRDGLGPWITSLGLQAIAFALLAARGMVPNAVSVVLANVLLMASLTFQAAALLAFHGHRLAPWWYFVPAIIVGMLYTWLLDRYLHQVMVGGLMFGVAMAVVAGLAYHVFRGHGGVSRWLMIASYVIGSLGFFARAVAAISYPDAVQEFLVPTHFKSVTYLVAFAVVLATSFDFLLMHKERADESAERLATTDPLTGALNRRNFPALAEREISRCRRGRRPLSLVMFDLDHFKQINDDYGHLVGDQVLQRLVQIVAACLRKEDLLVRYGGEEFCVLLPEIPAEGAVALAERLRGTVERAELSPRREPIPVTISAGVTTIGPEKTMELHQLLHRADEALYAAKRGGRNRIVFLP